MTRKGGFVDKRQRRRVRSRRVVSMVAWAAYEDRREAELDRLAELRKKLQGAGREAGIANVHGVGDGGCEAVECA